MPADRDARPPRPLALARGDIIVFFALWALTTLSRFAAIAKSPWDWDEIEFMRGVRAYDVALHAPHPPGYPVLIALAKCLRVFGDFRALQIIVVIAAMFLFPVVFYLARALRFSTRTALLGATLAACLPNVWFYGGTAFSDVPALVLALLACALLLRGRVLLGAIILGLALGIRTQIVLIALIPLILAIRRSSRMRAIAALAICAAIVIICYGGAAIASSNYFEAVHKQEAYLRATDSIGAPDRLPLTKLFIPFFVLPVDAPKIFVPIAVLAVISIATRRHAPLMTLALFGPFLLFAYLMLSQDAISRYAIGYIVMHALL